MNEMDTAIKKIDEREKQQIKALQEKKEKSDSSNSLLYSNNLLEYLRSFSIDQKINAERLRQDQIREFMSETEQNIRLLLDSEIE